MDEVLIEIKEERFAQDRKWGIQDHGRGYWMGILGEEVGEANRAYIESDEDGFRKEMIQVAAVAVAIVEAIKDGRCVR